MDLKEDRMKRLFFILITLQACATNTSTSSSGIIGIYMPGSEEETKVTGNDFDKEQAEIIRKKLCLPKGVRVLASYVQRGGTCAYHAALNARAVQELVEQKKYISSQSVYEKVDLYIDTKYTFLKNPRYCLWTLLPILPEGMNVIDTDEFAQNTNLQTGEIPFIFTIKEDIVYPLDYSDSNDRKNMHRLSKSFHLISGTLKCALFAWYLLYRPHISNLASNLWNALPKHSITLTLLGGILLKARSSSRLYKKDQTNFETKYVSTIKKMLESHESISIPFIWVAHGHAITMSLVKERGQKPYMIILESNNAFDWLTTKFQPFINYFYDLFLRSYYEEAA